MLTLTEQINKSKADAVKTAVLSAAVIAALSIVMTGIFPGFGPYARLFDKVVLAVAIRLLAESITIVRFGREMRYKTAGMTGQALSQYTMDQAWKEKKDASAIGSKMSIAMVAACAFLLLVEGLSIANLMAESRECVAALTLASLGSAAGAGYFKGRIKVLESVIENHIVNHS